VGRVIVVGGGIFGITGALALRARGREVLLFDPGPLPHPLAASTDISKAVRMDYGADEDYVAHMERALEGWRAWNSRWTRPLFHETGTLFVCRAPMERGGFEYESYTTLTRRGHLLQRLDAGALRQRFPAWSSGAYVDGYFNPCGGYAQSGDVVAELVREAHAAGVELRAGTTFVHLAERGSRVVGIVTEGGDQVDGDRVVIATGAWTPFLFKEMRACMRSVGQPVFHLKPEDPSLFHPSRFPVFGADIARSGYYGFPASADGVVKIANHGIGRAMHPESADRAVTQGEEASLRAFLDDTFPALAPARLVHTRVCLYCDTHDEHFWIACDPNREGLVVCTGGSGHAFKFAPLLGEWIADAVEGAPNASLGKFRWRPELKESGGQEAARKRG
jgi:glycine/D-amino acid oxidase-like deaminating enzyme